jgi:Na+-driven multidrug efflux pump
MSRKFRLNQETVVEEFFTWGKISLLSTVQLITELSPWLITLAFTGQISSVQLAALSLVELWLYTFLDIAWFSVTQTGSVVIAQADGAGSKSAKHGWFAISMIAMTFSSAFVAVMGLSTEFILPHITPDTELVTMGSFYARSVTPAIFFAGYHQMTTTYFTATGYAEYSSICSVFFCVVDVIITYIFLFGAFGIEPYDNALIGNAMSWNVSSFLGLIVNGLLFWRVTRLEAAKKEDERRKERELAFSSDEEHDNEDDDDRSDGNSVGFGATNNSRAKLLIEMNNSTEKDDEDEDEEDNQTEDLEKGGSETDTEDSNGTEIIKAIGQNSSIWDWLQSPKAWKRFLSILLPTVVTSSAESLIFLVLGLLVARLSRAQIAAHNTASAIIEYAFSLVFGMAEATSVRIGYYVGKGDYYGTQTVMWISIVVSFLLGLILSIVCSYYSRQIAELFTADPEIIHYIVQVSPILYMALAIFSSGDQLLAVLLGQGRSEIEMYLSIFALWGITCPLAYYWFYFGTGEKLPEIWWSLCIGYIVLEVIAVYYVYYSDWESLFLQAKDYVSLEERSEEDEEDEEEGEEEGNKGWKK